MPQSGRGGKIKIIKVHVLQRREGKTKNLYYFLCLETKKVIKENSRLQIILGLLFFSLPTQYNSLVSLAQTVLLTAGHRSKLQNIRYFPKFSEAV
jgi:hypothetical protein